MIIDLRASRIASLDDLGGLQPGLTDRDSDIARDIIDADPRVKAALTKRGLNIPGRVSDSVRLQYMAVGVDASLEQESNRLLRVLFASDQNADSDTSPFLDGVMAVVDLYSRKVIRFQDVAGVQSQRVPHDVFDPNMRDVNRCRTPLGPDPIRWTEFCHRWQRRDLAELAIPLQLQSSGRPGAAPDRLQ